jgi:hypothetical protein
MKLESLAHFPEIFNVGTGGDDKILWDGWDDSVRVENEVMQLIHESQAEQEMTQLLNAFCPTGIGGGVDPSCSPSSGAAASAKPKQDLSNIKAAALSQVPESERTKPVRPEGRDTNEQYTDASGKYSPERAEKVHEPAYKRMLQDIPKADGKPTVYMSGGGWGSGKSTLIEQFPEKVGFPKTNIIDYKTGQVKVGGGKAVLSDPDALKGAIPEYKKLAVPGPAGRDVPNYVTQESREMGKEGVERALRANKNVVYDSTGGHGIDDLKTNVARFRAAGAGRVEGNYAFPGSVEEAQRRTDIRAERSQGLRRYIPPSELRAVHQEVARTWFAAAKQGVYDKLGLWSTAGKYGDPPTLIATAEGGKISVHDQKQFDAFKKMSEAR